MGRRRRQKDEMGRGNRKLSVAVEFWILYWSVVVHMLIILLYIIICIYICL